MLRPGYRRRPPHLHRPPRTRHRLPRPQRRRNPPDRPTATSAQARSTSPAGSPRSTATSRSRSLTYLTPAEPRGNATLSDHFLAEIFLAQDTGIKDAAGKDIVNVFGGLKHGWQVHRS